MTNVKTNREKTEKCHPLLPLVPQPGSHHRLRASKEGEQQSHREKLSQGQHCRQGRKAVDGRKEAEASGKDLE